MNGEMTRGVDKIGWLDGSGGMQGECPQGEARYPGVKKTRSLLDCTTNCQIRNDVNLLKEMTDFYLVYANITCELV